MSLDKILKKIYEQVIQKGDNLKCEVCGREVLVQEKGKGPLICCGKPMVRIGETVAEAGFEDMPRGWNKRSVKKWANTLAKEQVNAAKKKGFFDRCVKKVQGKVANPEGLCAAAKDEVYGSTYWRGKGKSSKEVNKDTASHRNVS